MKVSPRARPCESAAALKRSRVSVDGCVIVESAIVDQGIFFEIDVAVPHTHLVEVVVPVQPPRHKRDHPIDGDMLNGHGVLLNSIGRVRRASLIVVDR